ncbi:hypothetical protein [Aneurinibacillus sp. REN35]|uniref:hypothetical protein n=1 Tax=Aneurinibacillus sp. REN35 TaxID=3237286 RepID=UPI0035275DCC
MKKHLLSLSMLLAFTFPTLPACSRSDSNTQAERSHTTVQSPSTKPAAQTEITRRGGGRGGVGITPRRPATDINQPRNRTPAPQPSPARGIGRGLFAFGLGALFVSILHPFSFVHGFGFSLLAWLFWAGVLFALYKLFRTFRSKTGV